MPGGDESDQGEQQRRRLLQSMGTAGLASVAGCTGFLSSSGHFEVTDLDPVDAELADGENLDVSATITNTGDVEETQQIEYRVDGTVFADEELTLAAEASTAIEFTSVVLFDLEEGEYDHGIFSADDSATGTISGVFSANHPESDPDLYEDSPALPPADAVEKFRIAPGFVIERVASEPLIDSPVDIKWDAKGRLWVVEMPDYMAISPGDQGSFGWDDEVTDDTPNGRVKVLEDVDGDGEMERATTFLDELTLARAISLVDGDDGLLVAHAGDYSAEADILYCADEDGDLEADVVEGVIDRWVNAGNPEWSANGLTFMMNNWIYNALSSERFQVRDGELIQEDTHNRGQWGISQNDWGQIITSQNHHWIHVDYVPGRGEYLRRNPDAESRHGVDEQIVSRPEVHTVHPNPGTNRSYRDGVLRDDGRLAGPRSTTGPGPYRGELFPEEYRNNVFVPCGKSNVVAEFELTEGSDGITLDAEHVLYDDEDWDKREFLAATDEVFRPVQAKTGPDGALYVVDMYNGIFQHAMFMTDYLSDYYLEHALNEVPPAGRIWRIYPEGAEPNDDRPELDTLSPEERAEMLTHENGSIRDTTQRLIVQNQDVDAADTLREIARAADMPAARMHALWALHGLDELDAESVFAAWDVDHSHVRCAAMETGEVLLETSEARTYVDRLIDASETDDLRVVVQAIASLGEVSDPDLQEDARAALEEAKSEHVGERYVSDAIDSSTEIDL